MRAKIFAAFTAAIVLIGLISGAAFAEKIITKVDVINKADRAVIRVQGNTALSMMPFSTSRGTYVGFQFPFRLGDRGRLVPIHGGRIHNVRYSNFKARPAITRFVVNTAGVADYSTEWSPDKRRLEISVWKHGAHKTLNRVQGDSNRQGDSNCQGGSACHAELVSASRLASCHAELVSASRLASCHAELVSASRLASCHAEPDSASPLAASAIDAVSESAPARVPIRAATPAPLTEESRKVYAALRTLGKSRAAASAVAAQQQRIMQPVVVASAAPAPPRVEPAIMPVAHGNPPVSPLCKGGRTDISPLGKRGLRGVSPLSEESRKAYAALRSLGASHKAATMVVAQQPRPAVKVMGMVESSPDVIVTVDPPRMGESLTIPQAKNVRLEYKINAKPEVAARAASTPSEPSGYGAGKRVSLNFLGADINDVLKALSVQSGENIVAAKDVKGEITVSLSDVTLEKALDYVAKLSGYNYRKENGVYLVASKDSLRGVGAGPSDSRTELVKLGYANADDVIALVKSQYPDVQISKVGVDIKNRVGMGSKGTQPAISIQNALLVLTGPEESVTPAKELINQFEDAFRVQTIESKRAIYKIKHVSAQELANTLATLIPGIAVTFAPTEGFDLAGPKSIEVSSSGSSVKQDDSDTVQKEQSNKNSAVDSVGLLGITGSAADTQSRVMSVEKRTRPQAIIITGREGEVEKAMALAAELDVRSPQIKIEAKVTSLNKSGVKKLGVKWDWSQFAVLEGFTDFNKASGTAFNPRTGTGEIIDENLQNVQRSHNLFARQPFNFAATLDAIITSGDGKVLASPNLLCLEGKPGVFFVGDEVTYIQRIETTPTGQNILTDTKQVGVQLRVVSDVSPDGYITLNLHPEVSVLKLNVDQGVSLPIVTRRFTDHIIRVKHGETIVIGGLIRNDELEEMSKVPLLGDLPFLGKLFRHKETTRSETEVVMFITASIQQD